MSYAVSTREIAKLVTFYQQHIRDDGRVLGIIRQIQRLTDKGIKLGTISQAMQTYLADPFVQALDERRRLSIRQFMTVNQITKWQRPIRPTTMDRSVATLEDLRSGGLSSPTTPIAPLAIPEDDDWTDDDAL